MRKKCLPLPLLLFLVDAFCYAQDQPGWAPKDVPDTALKEIIFVFKSHHDIGYTDYAEGVLQTYSEVNFPEAQALIDRTKDQPPGKQFVWTVAGWPMQEVLDRATPGLKSKLETSLVNGNLVFHALPFNMETESCDPEMMVRGMNISSTLAREYHLPLPRDAKQTDVPCHSWFLPTLLKHSGVDILHIGCNPASNSPEVPMLFWWEGPDGSRLMTFYYPIYYGTQLMPPAGWKYKTWLAIMFHNDNQGPPTYQDMQELIEKAHKLAPNATIRIGRISDFYDDIMKEHPELPVVRGDMPDTWIHGFMSMPREVKGSRHVSTDLFALESANTLYKLWTGGGSDIAREVSDAYTNELLFDEHTFGTAMSHGHSGIWAYGDAFRMARAQGVYDGIERSWKEKGDREFDAEKIVVPSLTHQLTQMAAHIAVKGGRIMVFNPLPWIRNGMVTIRESSQWNQGLVMKDIQTGELFPLANKDNVLRFYAKNIPAMGYRTYQLIKDADIAFDDGLVLDEADNRIENLYYSIRFDPTRGAISSIVDKRTGREMVDTHSQYGFGQYLYERFSKDDAKAYTHAYVKGGAGWADAELGRPNLTPGPHVTAMGGQARIVYSRDVTGIRATMIFAPSENIPHDYSITVTLPAHEPRIGLEWAINGKPAEPWPEAGWISLPFNVDHPSFRAGRLGAVVDPVKDFVKGSNFDYFFLNTGMAVIDSTGKGFGFSAPDAPGVSLDRPGLWKYSGYFAPEKPNVFVNLYNNVWSTNFTEWIEGSWSARLDLWSVEHFNNERSIITPAEESRNPLKAVMAYGDGGTLPPTATGIQLSRKGIVVTAFGKNPDGEGMILRLWEQAGESGKCSIILPAGNAFSTAQFCDLRGQASGKVFPAASGRIEALVKAYQPLSIILK
ncbi:MAG TPA: hypothetical protein VGS79_28345 [Puia sp.]|nr:hypothetical protein [Puia sp.]